MVTGIYQQVSWIRVNPSPQTVVASSLSQGMVTSAIPSPCLLSLFFKILNSKFENFMHQKSNSAHAKPNMTANCSHGQWKIAAASLFQQRGTHGLLSSSYGRVRPFVTAVAVPPRQDAASHPDIIWDSLHVLVPSRPGYCRNGDLVLCCKKMRTPLSLHR